MYYSLFAFLITLKSIRYMFLRHEEGTDFCKFVSLVQNINSHEEMATVSVYQCNVLPYSFFLKFIFKERVLLFAFCVVHISA